MVALGVGVGAVLCDAVSFCVCVCVGACIRRGRTVPDVIGRRMDQFATKGQRTSSHTGAGAGAGACTATWCIVRMCAPCEMREYTHARVCVPPHNLKARVPDAAAACRDGKHPRATYAGFFCVVLYQRACTLVDIY